MQEEQLRPRNLRMQAPHNQRGTDSKGQGGDASAGGGIRKEDELHPDHYD